MSHSEALPRLTVGDRRNDVIKWVLRRAIDLAATAVVGGFGLAAPAVAHAPAPPGAAPVLTMTPGGIAGSTAPLVGVIGGGIGGGALARSGGGVGDGTRGRGGVAAPGAGARGP